VCFRINDTVVIQYFVANPSIDYEKACFILQMKRHLQQIRFWLR